VTRTTQKRQQNETNTTIRKNGNTIINTLTPNKSAPEERAMNKLTRKLGYWSAAITALLAFLIDAGMITSTLLSPMTTITSIETYANSFDSLQMLPFIPSLLLAPMFVIMMLCIHHYASDDKKILSQLSFAFAVICAAILSIHYYIQLTVVQQGLLNNETTGLWLFATPNPHSFFWTFAALGYGFMGITLLCAAPVFTGKTERAIKWLFIANGIIGIAFLIGNAMGIFIVNILASFMWGVLFPIAAILVAKTFRSAQKDS